MDLISYFEPVDVPGYDNADSKLHLQLGDIIKTFKEIDKFPDLENIDIAIIGVKEDRNAINNKGCSLAPDYVRTKLYQLYPGNYDVKIADLGNIKRGFEVEDTYSAISTVVSEIMNKSIVPIIIGGSQDLTYGNYQAYEHLGQIINIVAVDPMFDLGKTEDELGSQAYLSKIIMHQPNYLFNYTNIGYQAYFVNQDAIGLMKNLLFDIYRLGVVRTDIEEVEPMVRNADMLSVDISSVRQAEAPGNGNATPNGFYGEELCQIVRYAGLSDKLTSIGFYEINPTIDRSDQTSHLVAQAIWYFIDGFYFRKQDFPSKEQDDFVKYIVSIEDHKDKIVFYKSKKSNRWWMEVTCPTKLKFKYERQYLVPCSYNDYKTACKDDIPDRWWQVYQKLM